MTLIVRACHKLNEGLCRKNYGDILWGFSRAISKCLSFLKALLVCNRG
jgi:hypothetical protein